MDIFGEPFEAERMRSFAMLQMDLLREISAAVIPPGHDQTGMALCGAGDAIRVTTSRGRLKRTIHQVGGSVD